MPTLESDITAAGRKIKWQTKTINLQDQVIRAYRHAYRNPSDGAAWAAVGSAEAALKFHKESAAESEMLRQLEEIDGVGV